MNSEAASELVASRSKIFLKKEIDFSLFIVKFKFLFPYSGEKVIFKFPDYIHLNLISPVVLGGCVGSRDFVKNKKIIKRCSCNRAALNSVVRTLTAISFVAKVL